MTGRGSKSGRAAGGPLPWLMWSLGALFFCYAFFQRVAPSVCLANSYYVYLMMSGLIH
jgi:hypothetical protein